MSNVFDVVALVFDKYNWQFPISARKVQSLVYYSQANYLVKERNPLFSQDILAWEIGPVVKELCIEKDGVLFITNKAKGNADCLCEDKRDCILKTIECYGKKTDVELRESLKDEEPWKRARESLDNVIQLEAIYEHYTAKEDFE